MADAPKSASRSEPTRRITAVEALEQHMESNRRAATFAVVGLDFARAQAEAIDHLHEELDAALSEQGARWIPPTELLPEVGQLIVFQAGSGAVFVGEYVILRDYPKFERQDGHGSYTPKAVKGWMPLPAERSEP